MVDRTASPAISRRQFIGASLAAGGAALAAASAGPAALGAGPTKAAPVLARRSLNEPWFEATIPELQRLMARREITSRSLTKAYLARIAELNPLLGAVIETDPQAIGIAARRDAERRRGIIRGPLHGIPIILKDNVATADRMETTAGSLALVGSRVPADAPLVANLRRAGAVILGKANLSEWANFRGFAPFNGWSARGGFTRNPYVLDWDPCGSSSGSAVAAAVNMCAGAIGTETDGSIVCPAGNAQVVGFKPTLGVISQQGIIPIAHSQDTAGPITRTVTDAAIMMNVLKSPFGPVRPGDLPADYTSFLRRGALQGARIGVDRRQFEPDYFADPAINAVVEDALVAMSDLGATIVDPVDTGDTYAWYDHEFTVLLYEFVGDVEAYLGGLRKTGMRSLADLIRFNQDHCPDEMKYFGQEVFELAQETGGDLSDPAYLEARAESLRLARDEGIDRVMAEHDLDAVISPSYAFGSSAPAVAGYPDIAVPCGFTDDGRPAGIWMYGGFLDDGKLLGYAYDLEQELQPRATPPMFLSSVPPEPPDAGLCSVPSAARSARPARSRPIHPATGRRVGRARGRG